MLYLKGKLEVLSKVLPTLTSAEGKVCFAKRWRCHVANASLCDRFPGRRKSGVVRHDDLCGDQAGGGAGGHDQTAIMTVTERSTGVGANGLLA